MAITRRHFVSTALTGSLLLGLSKQGFSSKPTEPVWYSGVRFKNGQFGVVGISYGFETQTLFKSDMRLHGMNLSPDGQWLVAPARRPGSVLFVYNTQNKKTLIVPSKNSFHYYGHGVFSADGKTYITAQNEYVAEKGCLVIHDVQQNFKVVKTIDSGGIGPHEITLCPRTGHIIVANGGILTHPDLGRAKLNLDTMAPNLCRIDLETGHVTSLVKLPLEHHQLSLRHLSVNQQGDIFVGAQDQAGIRPEKPLVWSWKNGERQLKPMITPTQGWGRFRGYIGSLVLDNSMDYLGVTSPRGNVSAFWDLQTNKAPKLYEQKDVCGLSKTTTPGAFISCTGQGLIETISTRLGKSFVQKQISDLSFDNHLLAAL